MPLLGDFDKTFLDSLGGMSRTGLPPRGESHVPASGDPRWEEWTEPLRLFLTTPRGWPEIERWRKGRMGPNLIRNALAWLEGKKRVYYDERNKTWASSPFALNPTKDGS